MWLARSGLAPALVDGSDCIWRAGKVIAEGGIRYDVFLHQSEGGFGSYRHRMDRLVFLREGADEGGLYAGVPPSFRISGAEVIFDHTDADSAPIRVGRAGFPQEVVLDGGLVGFEHLPDPKGIGPRLAPTQ